MQPFLFKIYFFLTLSIFVFAQEDKVVAKIGNDKIYESEFQERFDFSAHPKLLKKEDSLNIKKDFLYQLIAEKLLSLEAKEKGLDKSETFTNIITPLENIFVRDALYKNEITNNLPYLQRDIDEGIERIKEVLKIKFIFSKDLNEINDIHVKLKSGQSFDSLLALRIEVKDQSLPREITFGTMNKEIEDEVFKLKQGEFTNPLKYGDGYYILKLIDRTKNPNLKDPINTFEDVKKIVETRLEHTKYLDYYHNFFANQKASADKGIFEALVKIFIPKFYEKYNDNNDADNKIYLRGEEVNSALPLINDEIKNKDFIKLGSKSIKLKYFLNQLSQEGFFVADITEKSIRSSLSSYIRKFIEDELLTAEGYKKGFNNLNEVKKDLKMWEDAYLAKMMMASIFDSVNVDDDEVYNIYSKNEWKESMPDLVNVVKVVTDKLDIVQLILNELSQGKDLRDLAHQYSINDSIRYNISETGYLPLTQLGEIGKIASKMDVGEVYGPIKLDEGYSIFQIIDKKPDTTTHTKKFEDVQKELSAQLTLLKFEKYVNNLTANLANKYGVEIYEDVLKNIRNSFLDLVVVRYMGFGGEIFAVPYTEQFSGWYEIWLNNKLVQ